VADKQTSTANLYPTKCVAFKYHTAHGLFILLLYEREL